MRAQVNSYRTEEEDMDHQPAGTKDEKEVIEASTEDKKAKEEDDGSSTSRRKRLTSRKSIPTMGRVQRTMFKKATTMEYSPGPEQVKRTKLMEKKIADEIERRVQKELQKRTITKEMANGSISKKLFGEEDDEDDAHKEYRQRMEDLIEKEQKRMEAQQKKKEEQDKTKKEWNEDQKKIRDLQHQLEEEKKKNEKLSQKCSEGQWEEWEQWPEEDWDDDLHKWYQEESPTSASPKQKTSSSSTDKAPVAEDSKKEDPKKEGDVSNRELIKMMMYHQTKTLETVMKATTVVKEKLKGDQLDWLEDQKIRPTALEELPEISEGNSSIKCGDWIHRITPTMKNLSRRAGEFWQKSLDIVKDRYQKYLEASAIERLNLEFQEHEVEESKDYEKVRAVTMEMLLKAMPKDLAAEAITKRLDNPLKVLLLIMIKYQPGSRKEREAILNQITNPEACWTDDKALEGLRTWKRRLERARELKLVIPDPAILLAAIDGMTEKVIKKDQRKVFRMETLREKNKVDIIPTYKAVEDLTTFIEAELEESLNTTSACASPKVKSIFTDKPGGKGKGSDEQKGSKGEYKGFKGKGGDAKGGKGKKGKGEPCAYFLSEEGCRFGQTCKGYHRTLKPEEGKCYTCGSVKHQSFECERPKRESSNTSKGGKPKGGKPKGGKPDGGKGKPSIKQVNAEEHEEPPSSST